jgi:hypothetical protein
MKLDINLSVVKMKIGLSSLKKQIILENIFVK